ncbi:MAG TPA: nitrate ABC transporter ATP-binding protein [Clostridiales bacterium]|nr:nitrate ABC transporter ATP-binding protein [Clostridiales bacterium]
MGSRVILKNVSKTYMMDQGKRLDTLDDVSLVLNDKEFVSIVGPSGCGKSTIFRLITKIENEFQGEILINDLPVKDSGATISYMQQKDLLMPWRKVIDNVILPLEIKGFSRERSLKLASEHIDEFGLTGFELAYPNQLSGGMRQRAALLRTFLVDSNIMLLDEPFGALDAMTRTGMQEWLMNIWQTYQKSVLFITHDIDEAIFLSDRVYILSERPGHVLYQLNIDFDRPRNKSIMVSEKYLAYKKEISAYC